MEMDHESLRKLAQSAEGKEISILALRNAVLFPGTVMPLVVGRKKTMELLGSLSGREEVIGVLTQRERSVDDPKGPDLFPTGSLARTLKVVREGGGGSHIIVQGLQRFEVVEFTQTEPFIKARIRMLEEPVGDEMEVQAMTRNLRESASELVSLLPEAPSGAADLLERTGPPTHLAYLLISNIAVPIMEKIAVLEANDAKDVLEKSLEILHRQLEVLRVSQKISKKVKGDLSKTQREYVLRKQLEAIRKELADIGVEDDDVLSELKEKLASAEMSEEAQKVAEKELSRLKTIQASSPEYTVARTYLETLSQLPWNKTSEDNLDIQHADTILNKRHFGLEKVKRRLLEYIAVRKLRDEMRGPILCLVGPPGVGKTSLGTSVGEALGRKVVRMALGGVRDEAEIRGHRRTYIGAMPGKLIQHLKRAGTKNPVFILDEVDKLGRDWRGDPTSALLEVLDPEQNQKFADHYLDVEFDLSKVLFFATANTTDTIPAPLLDRMEILEIPGYTLEEKVEIALAHLVPRQLKDHGLSEDMIAWEEGVLREIVHRYTREAGVRNLERRLADICRATAVTVVEKKPLPVHMNSETLQEILGPFRFDFEQKARTKLPGVATGLAWTSVGGQILFIEVSRMPGRGKLRITGQLGDVMRESCEIAVSYVRTWAASYGLNRAMFEENDLHIHIPAGATPKDGPSAGVTIFTALVSLLTGIRVSDEVAMTGESTLRGLVLPVGGIKNKVMAAQRSGITKVLLPEGNRKDLPEIPESVRESLEIVFVERMEEVLRHALVGGDNLPFSIESELFTSYPEA